MLKDITAKSPAAKRVADAVAPAMDDTTKPSVVKMALDAVLASVESVASSKENQARGLTPTKPVVGDGNEEKNEGKAVEAVGRDAYVTNLKDAWRGPKTAQQV
jgi:hypothetical protein